MTNQNTIVTVATSSEKIETRLVDFLKASNVPGRFVIRMGNAIYVDGTIFKSSDLKAIVEYVTTTQKQRLETLVGVPDYVLKFVDIATLQNGKQVLSSINATKKVEFDMAMALWASGLIEREYARIFKQNTLNLLAEKEKSERANIPLFRVSVAKKLEAVKLMKSVNKDAMKGYLKVKYDCDKYLVDCKNAIKNAGVGDTKEVRDANKANAKQLIRKQASELIINAKTPAKKVATRKTTSKTTK